MNEMYKADKFCGPPLQWNSLREKKLFTAYAYLYRIANTREKKNVINELMQMLG